MKLIHILLSLVVAVFAVAFVATPTYAVGLLQKATDTMTNPVAGGQSSHTFAFSLGTTNNLGAVKFEFCTTASGTCTKPANLDLTTPGIGLGSITGFTTGGTWSLNTSNAGSGSVIVQTDTPASNNQYKAGTIPLTQITNPAIGNCSGSGSSDTCFVWVTTYSDTSATTAVDSTTLTYTVVQSVQVTAKVDPTFTFVVTGVGASTVTNGITTSVASTYSTLPFSNLTAGTPKYAAHKLNVTTNTQGGYTVSMAMTNQMTGVYSANNIDPFIYNGSSWSTAVAWTHPTGTSPSVDTGWIGANTSDGRGILTNAPTAAGVFGPVSATPNNVMAFNAADNGTTGVYVTYAIEANVFQPADQYTGALVYNALPTY